jgi:hypothetical protein
VCVCVNATQNNATRPLSLPAILISMATQVKER